MRHVRVTIAAVKKRYYIFWMCVCSLSYPVCKGHVPYFIVIFDLSGCTIFSHLM